MNLNREYTAYYEKKIISFIQIKNHVSSIRKLPKENRLKINQINNCKYLFLNSCNLKVICGSYLSVNTETAIQHQADRKLVAQILNRDPQAFKKLIVDHERLVAHLVYKMIPVVADRRDVIQDIYIKVHNNLSLFRFQCKLSTWIGQITYNTCLHYLQKKRPILLENFFEDADSSYPGYQVTDVQSNETESRLFARELTATITQALSQLSALYQTLIALHYQQELSLQEIAEITKLPEGTIKSYLFRARRQLKDILLKSQKREEL